MADEQEHAILAMAEEGIALVTLNRPEQGNAHTQQMRQCLDRIFRQCDGDDAVRAIVVTGAGKAFSAGRDVEGVLEGREFPGAARYRALEKISKPVIAAVNGACFTGSLELVLYADIIIAPERAVFADTHARFGIIPGGGQTQILPRLVGMKRAKEILFTCEPLSAHEAQRLGIVNKVVPLEKLDEAAWEMAEKIRRNIPEALRIMKRLINEGMSKDLESGLQLEAREHTGPINPRGEGRARMTALLKKK